MREALKTFLSMFQHLLRSLILSGALAATPAAYANVILSDNFSNISQPRMLFDQPLPLGWSIGNDGAVNVLGTCNGYNFETIPDFQSGENNCYVDLDGNIPQFDPQSALPAGLLTRELYLNAEHIYKASFDLAGNQVYPFFGDTVYVGFGSTNNEFYIAGHEDFTTFEVLFTPSTSDNYLLTFMNSNLDAYGALLDNVVVTDTSVPAPLPLLGAGVAFSYHRRLRLLHQKLHGRPPSDLK